MMEMTTVNEAYPDWLGTNSKGGFFYYLNQYATDNEIDIPFISKWSVLDYQYHGNMSGDKFVSPLIEKLLYDGSLPDSEAIKIAEMFWTLFSSDILAVWNLDFIEYRPLCNYDMHEDTGVTDTKSETTSFRGTETNTRNGSVTEENKVQGFDSSSYKPSDKTDTTYTNLADVTSFDGRANAVSGSSNKDTLSDKYGNIGTSTTQRLIGEERNVREWNFYMNFLFKKVDSVLTIPVF